MNRRDFVSTLSVAAAALAMPKTILPFLGRVQLIETKDHDLIASSTKDCKCACQRPSGDCSYV